MRSPLVKQLYHHETALSNKPTMKNKIDYIEKFFKQWIFPCRIFVPIDFFSTNTNERYFYIDFIDSLNLTFNEINFSSYLEIKLTKQDNNIAASSFPHSCSPNSQDIDTLTLTNGKYLSNGDYIKNFTHATIICDYKDIPRILSHYILPKQLYVQSKMESITNEILRKLQESITCHQTACNRSLPPMLYQISQR